MSDLFTFSLEILNISARIQLKQKVLGISYIFLGSLYIATKTLSSNFFFKRKLEPAFSHSR